MVESAEKLPATNSQSHIGLNVGGRIYLTSRKTLTRYPDSFFATLIDSDIPSARDDQGNYLIDRDGEIFRHVLNFMRCGELVLPRGFDEFDLLDREADFYILEVLQESVRNAQMTSTQDESVGIAVGMGGNRSLYKMTRKSLNKEKDSFFSAMLEGKKILPLDTEGNYVINRSNSLFHHIVDYLVSGGIINDISGEELPRQRRESQYFGLKILEHHVDSVEFMRQKKDKRDLYIHLFQIQNGHCIAYSNRPSCDLSTFGPDMHIITWKSHHISEGDSEVFVGVIGSDDISKYRPGAGSVTLAMEWRMLQCLHVQRYNSISKCLCNIERSPLPVFKKLKLSDECTKINVYARERLLT